MVSIENQLSSISIALGELEGKLSDSEMDFKGPESDSDYSRLAKIWEALRQADEGVGLALDNLGE